MESLVRILERGQVVRKNLAKHHNSRMRSFVTDVPGLPAFVRSALNTQMINASFFEVDEISSSPFRTHDVMVALSASSVRNWHFGYQRTLIGGSQGQLFPEYYRFYLVPTRNPTPVMNFRKFARRIALTQRRVINGQALSPLEKVSFARLRPHERGREYGFCLDYVHIRNDEASEVPTEFMNFVSCLGSS
ncbi:hypothetical protein HZB94_02055 [Candidatus Falkowbacteria bacterium]|nr:hypothetical protein [Candidatus Falkowbacteria bacterium]